MGRQRSTLLQWTAAADKDPAVVRAAIASLTRIAASATPHAAQAVSAIAALAADLARRTDAVAALASLPEAAIPWVGDALSAREPAVRRAIVEALGRLAHPAASAYIVTALNDGDAAVRQAAVTVLSRLGTRGVARSFADLAANDPSQGVRHAAEIALRRLDKDTPDAPSTPGAA